MKLILIPTDQYTQPSSKRLLLSAGRKQQENHKWSKFRELVLVCLAQGLSTISAPKAQRKVERLQNPNDCKVDGKIPSPRNYREPMNLQKYSYQNKTWTMATP